MKNKIAEVNFDCAEYVGDGRDGVYVQAAYYGETEHEKGWYVSCVVDSDTGSFVDGLVSDDGPWPTETGAMDAGRGAAKDWCIENSVNYEEGDDDEEA